MGRKCGFTLVEMLLVLMIIAVLIALLVVILPQIIADSKDKQTRVLLAQLSNGLEAYKNAWGSYPTDYLLTNDNRSYDTGAKSLYLALQGPDGAGWNPQTHRVDRQFGPVFESMRGMRQGNRDAFFDAFGGVVLYYGAHMEYPMSLSEPYYNCRYRFATGRSDWYQQRDDARTVLTDGGAYQHWKHHLTQDTVNRNGKDVEIPYNPTTYILWTPGADGRFGYLRYNQSDKKYHWDIGGITDDITNFR